LSVQQHHCGPAITAQAAIVTTARHVPRRCRIVASRTPAGTLPPRRRAGYPNSIDI
jgi:hypothetical protein